MREIQRRHFFNEADYEAARSSAFREASEKYGKNGYSAVDVIGPSSPRTLFIPMDVKEPIVCIHLVETDR